MPFPTTHPALERALETQGYAEPTSVQAAVLAPEAAGRDLLVSAQTGSGKTVAFGLALASTLLGEAEDMGVALAPKVLIVAPTRELAIQVSRELTWLYGPAKARIATCVGGMDARREQRDLAAGRHIVVGTPGRLRDHLERGNLDLSELQAVVLDEADEMLDMGFREDLEFILEATPPERRTLLFSATIPREIAALAKLYQRDALRIDTARRDEPHGDIVYKALRVAPNEVERAVVNVLRFFESPGALVFCNTREAVRHLHVALRERGFQVVALSGELTQKERTDALQSLRDGRARVCVATDVAARGLDLPDLGLVIHAETPVNKAALLHRSGRTGRAGKKGVSILLVPFTRRRKVEQLLGSASIEAEWGSPPSAEQIRAGDQQRLLAEVVSTEAPAEEDLELAKAVLEALGPEKVAAALVRMVRARLPEPEELFEDPRDRGGPQAPRDAGSREDRPRRREPDFQPRADYAGGAGGDFAWFRMTVGRSKNADPKWLIPLICRLGHVTKKDIGAIRIFDRETKFEIAADAQERFAAAVKATLDEEVKIEPAHAPGPKERTAPPRPPHGKPAFQKDGYQKPAYKKDYKDWSANAAAPETGGYDPSAARPEFRKDRGPRPDQPSGSKPTWEKRPAYGAKAATPKAGGYDPSAAKPEFKKERGPRKDNAAGPKAGWAAPGAKPPFAKKAGGKKPPKSNDRRGPRPSDY